MSSPNQYFVLIVPACAALLGIAMIYCWSRLRDHRYLLWIASGYISTAIPMGIHSLMPNEQLARWTLPLSAMYLYGVWALSHGVALRFGGRAHPRLAGVIVLVTLGLLFYFSQIDDDLWLRLQILNWGLALLVALPIKSILSGRSRTIPLATLLRASYLTALLYAFVRVFALATLIPREMQPELTRSGFWLLMLATNMFISIWVALAILTSTAMSIVQTLDHERSRDPLTRLLNRRAFFEQVKKRLELYGHSGWAVMTCDLDHFKMVNDTWGHVAGDRALKEFGALLARTVRQDDLAARFGGEEFVLLIRSTSLHTAVLVAERLRSSVMNLHIPATAHTLTASFGVVQLNSNGDINQAIEQADRLLYEAKHAGRNKVVWKAS
ncbi:MULTISPECIES: GGDEF domain-containing protein [Alcaligenes]|uniref:GGDEF domain-containing protein n=1 Tax=Alcaligenes TaxID=507 RepID=UPI0005A6738E|nr:MULTISPECIES: GGDEF domain-containing protein [Alcaligenes]ATI00673.1 GGDEF domain-containing protein [Alcaligenes faecalis]AYZ90027.1 GGDEF domain-containing protein [Alcaligenes faecalis]MCX5596136.1 GGDEF domain-containing protein [Alcaligenes faecalis]MDT0219106.1 GGDEF domain-containing protein [Alcaligenes sp. AB3]QQC34152.1 GGDEF domain-containing protein [Alcaligenes faecalis]